MTTFDSAPAAPAAWQRIGWHHLRARVPSEWEVSAYSVEDRAGRLEFATRAGLMGVVSWEPCEREPDRRTTMLSFLRNNILGRERAASLSAEALRVVSMGIFEVGWTDAGGPCQAIAYDAAQRKLIRWILEPPAAGGRPWPEVARAMLEDFDFNAGELVEYALYGIHARMPRAYELEDMVVLPANVMLAFEHARHKRRATLRRWGLPETILAGATLAAFHARILRTGGGTVQAARPCEVDGMEACVSVYAAPREHHMDRYMGRRWHGGQAVIWHDRAARRLYAFEQIGPAGSPALDFAGTLAGRILRMPD